ncbi:MAG: alpha/beta hydrolase [Candidatus Galacturonibacter soehngenii]|nr:alpha/beta hydrolase [Candidatus Galacturonibacter soehngenii]
MKKHMNKTGKIVLWIVVILVALIIISAIVHNILKPFEKNKYKMGQTIEVDGGNMQAYTTGAGEKTIVLLSGLGTASPIIDFMPLAERLGKDYKVVILEYFGYGFSDSTMKERSNENIVKEIRIALQALDAAYPLPPIDDGMNEYNYYSEEQMKRNKMATAWNSGNRTVINEYNMGNANTKELYDVKYPNDLPILAFLATESVSDGEWLPLHEELISNSNIQMIEILEGGHYLHWSNADNIARMTKKFISKNLNGMD